MQGSRASSTSTHLKVVELSERRSCPVHQEVEKTATESLEVYNMKESCEVLNLEGKCQDLDALPKCTLKLADNIRKLNLSFNYGIALQHICRFRAISELHLHSCHLKEVPEEVVDLVNLRVLILSYNDILEIPHTVEKLDKLEALDLSGNRRMENLSPSISRLKRLRSLNLSSCSLSCLPEELSDLTCLETLDVSDNSHLMSVSLSVTRLPMLQVLNLSCCAISHLPKEMVHLSNLVELNVSNNPLAITVTLNLPSRLVKFSVSGCRFEACWPSDIEFMTTIEELNISDNPEIDTLLPAIGRATSLRSLTVSFCNLKELPDAIGQLLSLESLDCSYNRSLTHLPSTLVALKTLKYLDFRQCSISTLPEDIGLLESLEELDLSYNSGIIRLPLTAVKLSKLRKLTAAHCSLIELPSDVGLLNGLEELDISDNADICQLPSTIGELAKLKKLSAARCSLSELPSELGSLNDLEHLDVRSNHLTLYPLCTLYLPKLKVLILSNDQDRINGNLIQTLPNEVITTCLTSLDLDGNSMVKPPSIVCQRGIDAIKAYMKVENTNRVPGCAINFLECMGTTACNSTSAMFHFGTSDTVILNGCSMVLNDLTILSDYPEVVSEFLSDTGITVVTCKVSEASLELIGRMEDDLPLKQGLHRWLLTVLSRFSKSSAVLVAQLQVEKDDLRMVIVERWIAQLIKDFFAHIQEDAKNFLRRPKFFENSTEPDQNVYSRLEDSLMQRAAYVHALVVHREVNVKCALEALFGEKLQQELIIRPLVFPVWWHTVVSDILCNLRSSSFIFPCITWHQVQDIFNFHSSHEKEEECHRSSLIAILQYLSSSAQITWMRDHPLLGEYILGPPRVLLKAVHDVLACGVSTNMAHADFCKGHLDDLRNGFLHERLLGHIIPLGSTTGTVAFHFMKAIGVICESLNDSAEASSIGLIVSRLPQEPPTCALLKSCEFQPALTIIIRFIGFIIPYSFFENCLFTILSHTSGLEKKPLLWRHGISFTQNGVSVTLSLVANAVSISAQDETCSSDIWGVLYPLLQRLASSIRNKWKGIQPIYTIVCPRCLYIVKNEEPVPYDNLGNRVLPDLDMVRLQSNTSDEWICSVCHICIPSYLSFPRMPGCLLTEDKFALMTLKRSIQNAGSCAAIGDLAQRGMSPTPVEKAAAQTKPTVHMPESEADVLLSCPHMCCKACVFAGKEGTLHCSVCEVDAPVRQKSSVGFCKSFVNLSSSCQDHQQPCESFCTSCNSLKCSDCLIKCQLAGHLEADAARGMNIKSDENQNLPRLCDTLGNDLNIRKNYLNEVRSARLMALDILYEKKMHLFKCIEAEYSKRKEELLESFERLEKLAIAVQRSAEQLEKALRHALDYASHLIMAPGALSDIDRQNEQEKILSRLLHLQGQLHSTGPAPTKADLVGDCSLPIDVDFLIEKWMATPRAPPLSTPPANQIIPGVTSASMQILRKCSHMALTNDGRLLVAAGQDGLIELSSNGSELSRWLPSPEKVSGKDNVVRVVVALNDGRAAVVCANSPMIVLLRRSHWCNTWSVDRLFDGFNSSPWHVAVQDNVLAVVDACGLHLMNISSGQLLHQIEELHIDGNEELQSQLPTLVHLSRLKKLNISRCFLTTTFDWCGDLHQLQELNLSSNLFPDGLSPAIGRLHQLRKLELGTCELTCIPDSLGDLKVLEELNLSMNNLSQGINQEIGGLSKLKKLDLRGCQLKFLPDCIGDLKQLEILCLAGNCFSDGLNPEMRRLQKLKQLDLRSCCLPDLPEWISEQKQLEELNLSMNNLSQGINQEIGDLSQLKKLDLHGCQLKSLPDCIGDLKQLVDLQLSDNMLQEYPLCTLRINSLKVLDVSNLSNKGNCIAQLPIELAFTNLEVMKINGNPITDPPREIWIQGIDAIKSFMRAIIPGGALMHADTINMIGDTGAGKTSLAQSLDARAPLPTTEANRTHVLQQLQMKTDDSARQCVTINDFGGHELYHSVMPIFLPTNGLVILVFDLSGDLPEKTVKKWLLTVISKCREIRVILAGTHADQLTGSEERSAVEEKMTAIIFRVFLDALDEVDAHINSVPNDCTDTLMNLLQLRVNLQNALADFLHSPISDVECQINRLRRRPDMLSNIRRFLARLERTETKRSISSNEAVRFVTLSCLVANELDKMYDLVVKLLRPPALFPVTWFRIINDIRNKNVESLYITMQQVKDICKEHLAASKDSSAVTIILRYLSKTSQIIWLEGHPELSEFIFHSPKTIIEVCKTILLHNNAVAINLSDYKSEIEEYKKGYLWEPLLKRLLPAHVEVASRNEEYALPSSQSLTRSDVIVKFLQDFNLISYIATHIRGQKFIVPCKLESNVPSRLHKLEDKGDKRQNRVIVRLSFIGSIIPLGLFETSLASMVTVACKLATEQLVCPDIWKEGLIIEHNEVCFISKMTESDIILTAFSKSGKPNPWTVLRPILKRLTDNMTAIWHGSSPRCVIVCPSCKWIHRGDIGNQQIGEIETELKTLSVIRQTYVKPTCLTCRKLIPRSLCFPTKGAGSLVKDQIEVQEFFGSIERKCSKASTSDDCSSKRITLSEPGIANAAERSELLKRLRKTTPQLTSQLDRHSVMAIADELLAARDGAGLITFEHQQRIQAAATDSEKARTLLNIVCSRGDEAIVVMADALRSDQVKRPDLAALMYGPSEEQNRLRRTSDSELL